ncbi:Hvo_1808 family surface protein [Halosimplex halophilum]|uniref:Hvo_1808 family surface protein n=1 Tax=Halosimplex halophilum TaxID=2559572 RepID=UPI001AE8C9AE|nr:Hvo_1808 family surface protein [Halosimplex halophilum]
MRSALSAVVAGLVVLSAVAAVPAASAADPADAATTDRSPTTADASTANASTADRAQSDDACAPLSEGSPPDNPDGDPLGWENGCWYNESIDVDRSDGLNETELDAVVARSMARVEQVRELEFNETVPVRVVSREQFRAGNATGGNHTVNNTLHQNVKWEAMLMVGEDTDAISVQERNTGATVGGYYSPREERIVVVSENATAPKMNEITLSQELFHALQDQRYNLSAYDQYTRELHNARDGIIEGDGNLVDRLYSQRCASEWDCLMPQTQPGGGGAASIHYGIYFVTYQPYSDGPKFVEGIYRAEGWEGVNAVYENPPASTEQTIHPEKYGEDPPTNVSFTDTSGEAWTVPHLENGTVDYAQFGEAGLATMLFYPTYASGGEASPVVGVRSFFNYTAAGSLSTYDPFNYTTRYTDGWDGDRLYPYVTDDSAETNETGYVWKTVWDSEGDAAEFVQGYSMLLDYYGAEPVDDSANTYRIPEGPYADAFYVNHTGTTVTLVNAPSVEELSEVRAGAAPDDSGGETETPTDTATDEPGDGETATDTATDEPDDGETPTDTATGEPGDEGTDTATETPLPADGDAGDGGDDGSDGEATDAPAETTASGGPGFGLAGALVALALAGLLAGRRE